MYQDWKSDQLMSVGLWDRKHTEEVPTKGIIERSDTELASKFDGVMHRVIHK